MSQQESASNNEEYPEAVVVRHHRFSIIWVVPLIALGVAGWLLYKSYANRGTDITITFEDGSGLAAGKTELQFRGVQVGIVNKVHLDDSLKKVVVEARVEKSAAGLATQGAAFWVERPEIGLSGVRGLDTLLSGPYIGILPGDGKTAQANFIGLPEQPAAGPNEPGLNILLQADKLASLQVGAPVYYREFKVGEVDQVSLASDAQTVHVHVHIQSDYENLVHENTRFWNASGIGMNLGLLGVKVKTESLQSILTGGIAFATPPNDEMGAQATDGTVFELYSEPKDEWDKWSPSIQIADTVAKSQVFAAETQAGEKPPVAETDPGNTTVKDPAGTAPVKGTSKPDDALIGPPSHHR